MSRIASKPVPFTDNERDLLDWAAKIGKPFATYVKDLIRKDMENKSNRDEIKSIVKEVLNEISLPTKTSANAAIKVINTKKDKAIKGLLNDLNK